MQELRWTRRQIVQTAALLVSSTAVSGCGGRRVETSQNAAAQSGWEAIKSDSHGPGPRSRHCLVYDSGARACVLFGGMRWAHGGLPYGDSWELRDGHWSSIEGTEPAPGRQRAAMAHDPSRAHSVLFGGQGKLGRDWLMLG